MTVPRWTAWLLRRLAREDRSDDLIGDLEEAHRARLGRRSGTVAALLTTLEALDLARALVWSRMAAWITGISLLDFKLAFRMLLRCPGLSVIAGLSMTFAIWASASVFEFFHQIVGPTLPLDEGDRIPRSTPAYACTIPSRWIG